MKITLCITTHCTKTESGGLYAGINNIVPSTPSTRLVETVISNFFEKTSLSLDDVNIHIGFDKRKNRSIDEEYHQNLLNLQKKFKNLKVFINLSESTDPIVTAPSNFLNLINSVETDFYILWEHDWMFKRDVNLIQILEEMNTNPKINYIRFNQFNNNNIRYNNLVENGINPSNEIPLIPTFRWSNNPYICRTKIFKDWWSTFVYPTSNEGGFVEGPLNEFYTFYIDKMGFDLASNKFGCYVFGEWNDDSIVTHLNGNGWF